MSTRRRNGVSNSITATTTRVRAKVNVTAYLLTNKTSLENYQPVSSVSQQYGTDNNGSENKVSAETTIASAASHCCSFVT